MYVGAIGRTGLCAHYLVCLCVCDEGGEWRNMKLIVVIKRCHV